MNHYPQELMLDAIKGADHLILDLWSTWPILIMYCRFLGDLLVVFGLIKRNLFEIKRNLACLSVLKLAAFPD